jgi:N-acyl-D-aspartate/D-glutamate deacylase
MAFDTIFKGGTVIDGTGLPGYRADVGVTDDRITAIGNLKGEQAKETIDAEGQVVAPGFVDGHTHMDAQVFWDDIGGNSCWHGVTSVVMGNCGFTLAPCAEADKDLVLHNLERAEDISPAAMKAGIPWSWTTFSEYLDAVDARPKGLNYAGYVGHSALRTHVMGERAMEQEASADDLEGMKRELESGLRAGAIGLSTSRSHAHRTPEGKPVASRMASWDEFTQLVGVLEELGTGVVEMARDNIIPDPEARRLEHEQIKNLAVQTGVPVTFGSSFYKRAHPDQWREQFQMVDEARALGAKMLIQGTASWNCSLRSFETMTPYDYVDVWKDFRKLSLKDQEAGLRDPSMRKKLVDAVKAHTHKPDPALPNAFQRPVDWNWVFPVTHTLPPFPSVAELARERGLDGVDIFIDMALERHLKLFFVQPSNNEDQDFVKALIRHPATAVTFSDAGAHVATTLNPIHAHLLGHWVRAEQALTLEAAIRKITFEIASFWGLRGRGWLREGNYADVVVFDPDVIAPAMPYLVHDLPAQAPRIIQKSDGIKCTMVNGSMFMRENEHTGAHAGRLLRGPLYHN